MTNTDRTLKAWEDWEAVACMAVDAGMDADEIDAKYAPNPQDGWVEIRGRTKALKAVLDKRTHGPDWTDAKHRAFVAGADDWEAE